MFELRRLDVWPVDDLGVRQGYGSAWRLDPHRAPSSSRRSIVARYCWAAVALFRSAPTPPFGSSVEAIAVGRRRRETAVSLVCLMY
jgi:3-methyladenine DNA glycosylase/8-oxoguanine DNA glycosylase